MKNYLMLMWHMHQPFYKDLAEGVYSMPWVRLHALKDYYGMVAILREFPSVRVTFNIVPSLITQLEEYARGEAREEEFDIAFKPAEHLTVEERAKLLGFAFQLNPDNLLNRYPRFRELHEKAQAFQPRSAGARLFTSQEILDLQVLSQLAWFDEIYLDGDPSVRRLVAWQRGYAEEDKAIVHRKEIEIFKVTLEEYREALERGQIEISTSPFYHPILPLLCDSNVAEESHAGVKLPHHAFQHPEDAIAQLRAAVALHQRVLGRRPRGLWPSEGSVSDEVLALASAEGFEWAATDEGVLARSLGMGFHRESDGKVSGGRELYRPHRFSSEGRSVALFFRDHELSDLIGFVYSRMNAQAAAADLHNRIRAVARSTGDKPALVSIILDGENAWEFFPGNGREFLRAFYGRIASDPELQAVTPSESLALVEAGELKHVVPGSWINANFDVWIGADEDNRAWDLLSEARTFFAQHSTQPGLDAAQVKLAQEELWIAEGSDWCWWYGPEHSSGHDEEFDLLYRKHLSNIYRLIDASPPDELAVPIKQTHARPAITSPMGAITAKVDGEVTNYYEWLGAGVYAPSQRSGSMHGAAEYLEALYFGHSNRTLFLRIDFSLSFLEQHTEFEVRVKVDGERPAHIHAPIRKGALGPLEVWKGNGELQRVPVEASGVRAAFGRIFELALDSTVLGLAPKAKLDLQVSLWVNQLPVQIIPQEDWLTIDLSNDLEGW